MIDGAFLAHPRHIYNLHSHPSFSSTTTCSSSIDTSNMGIFEIALFACALSASSVYVPRLTVHNEAGQNPVKQIQTWSTWKGLSSLQAEELIVAELALRDAIQEKILAYLDGFKTSYPALHDGVCTIKVNIVELAMEIVEKCFETCDSPSPLLDLPNMVQFVRVQQYFSIPTSIGQARMRVYFVNTLAPPIRVDELDLPAYPQPDHAPIPVDDIDLPASTRILLHAPKIIIDDLVVWVEPGQNYYLRPRYMTEIQDTQVTYTTACDWLKWNHAEARFEGAIPQRTPRPQIVTRPVLFKAMITHWFQGTKVRFEQTTTLSVTLLVSNGCTLRKQVRFADDSLGGGTTHCSKDSSRAYSSSSGKSLALFENWACSSSSGKNQALIESTAYSSSPSNKSLAISLSGTTKCSSSSDQSLGRAGKSTWTYPPSLHISGESDGISSKLFEAARNMTDAVEFAEDEDPRDVREMRKDLVAMAKQDMEKKMLGYRVDRWSSE